MSSQDLFLTPLLPPGPCLLGPSRQGEATEAAQEDTGQPVLAQETEGASVHSWPRVCEGVEPVGGG